MKIIILSLFMFLYPYSAKSLRCFDCFIDGPLPLDFLKPFGPGWNRCTGTNDDHKPCDGICTEILLYGNDISRYQVLRSCSTNPDICNIIEINDAIHVGNCRTCDTEDCNDVFPVDGNKCFPAWISHLPRLDGEFEKFLQQLLQYVN